MLAFMSFFTQDQMHELAGFSCFVAFFLSPDFWTDGFRKSEITIMKYCLAIETSIIKSFQIHLDNIHAVKKMFKKTVDHIYYPFKNSVYRLSD